MSDRFRFRFNLADEQRAEVLEHMPDTLPDGFTILAQVFFLFDDANLGHTKGPKHLVSKMYVQGYMLDSRESVLVKDALSHILKPAE